MARTRLHLPKHFQKLPPIASDSESELTGPHNTWIHKGKARELAEKRASLSDVSNSSFESLSSLSINNNEVPTDHNNNNNNNNNQNHPPNQSGNNTSASSIDKNVKQQTTNRRNNINSLSLTSIISNETLHKKGEGQTLSRNTSKESLRQSFPSSHNTSASSIIEEAGSNLISLGSKRRLRTKEKKLSTSTPVFVLPLIKQDHEPVQAHEESKVIWNQAIEYAKHNLFKKALQKFSQDLPSARREFNIGICFLHLKKIENAFAAFYKSIEFDRFHSIAFFQLAGCAALLGRRESAVKYYRLAKEYMAGKFSLDYSPKGLEINLLMADVDYNLVLSCINSQMWEEASFYISEITKLEEETYELQQLADCVARRERCNLSFVIFSEMYTSASTSLKPTIPHFKTQSAVRRTSQITLRKPEGGFEPAKSDDSLLSVGETADAPKIRIKCTFKDDARFVLLPADQKANYHLLQRLITEKFFTYNLEIWFGVQDKLLPLKTPSDMEVFFKSGDAKLFLSSKA